MSIEKIMATVLPKLIKPKEEKYKEWLQKEKESGYFYVGILDPEQNTYTIEKWKKINSSHGQKVKDDFNGRADEIITDIIKNISGGKNENETE